MNRLPFALCTLGLAGVLAAAGGQASGATFQERLSQFYARNDAERRKLGLDDQAAKRKYPTPEVSLVSTTPTATGTDGEAGEGVVCLQPGKTLELVLAGQVQPGSLVDLTCDALTLVEQKQEGGKLRLKARAKPDALPTTCSLMVVAPVSGIQTSLPVARVGGRYAWEVKLANGLSGRWVLDSSRCGETSNIQRTPSDWARAGKALGTRELQLSGDGPAWRGSVDPNAQEQQETSAGLEAAMSGKDHEEAMAKLQELSEKMGEECGKLAPANMGPCFEKYQKRIEPYAQRLKATGDAMQTMTTVRKVGCAQLDLTVGAGGVVQGKAEGCGAPGETTVTGKVAVVGAP